MSNGPMRGGAEYPAGAWCMDWSAEIQRKRDALRSYLAVLEEARRRLDEIQHDAGGQLVPSAGGGAAAADESSDTASVDFYPLDNADDGEPEEERPMQWQNQVCRQMVYNHSSRHLRQDDDDDLVGKHAYSDNHGLDLNDKDDDGGEEISRDIVTLGLHVPHIETGTATPPFVPGEDTADGGDGFGAVPASAAAIAGLGKHTYDGSSGGDSMCAICMRDYKKGRRLRVMPCTYKHRFHGRCIREWLSLSNLCPLCRHALPTAADAEQGGAGGVRRRVLVRVNINPY